MGFYDRHIVPLITDKVASGPEAERHRKRTLASARGRVLEIGFGTGLNAPHYPSSVERVIAIEPNPGALPLARKRLTLASVPIELQAGSGEALPFPDGSFDTVVTTLVLCTIPEVERALGEMRRVLGPDGRYLFLEHGLAADDPKLQRWQRRLNRANMWLAGGCHADRPIRRLVEAAGFHLEQAEDFYLAGAPRHVSFTTLGEARAASR